MERTLVNKKRKADERRTRDVEHCSGKEVVRGQVHKCDPVDVDKEEEYEEMSEEELGVWLWQVTQGARFCCISGKQRQHC